MYRLVADLIVYENIGQDSILRRLADICRQVERLRENQPDHSALRQTKAAFPDGSGRMGLSREQDKEELRRKLFHEIHRLLDLATQYGFDENLWHNYLAFLLAMTETPFTLVSEKAGGHEGSVNVFVRHDLRIFKQLFDYDFTPVEQALDVDCFQTITHFHAIVKSEQVFNRSVSEKVQELSRAFERAQTDEELYQVVTAFYARYGVGTLGLNKAFRLVKDPEQGGELLVPITNTSDVKLDDLVGYDIQKRKLRANTDAFVDGRRANNVLLYGDAGTGKSTSIKAILNEYYGRGLRMIEVYKHEFRYLSRIMDEIKNRNYRFVIFMDDLSFEESELEYKYLKAVIEGGLETRPDNVLIYATSNRRHLVRETWKDKADLEDEDIHRSDTVQEKLSLADRFGLTIGYFRPSPAEYLKIVRTLADRYPEIRIPEKELRQQANIWEMNHGGFSGRTAQQFVDYLAGTYAGTQQVQN